MSFKVQLKGFEKLERALKALPRSGARAAMKKALRAGVKPVLKAVREDTPRDRGLTKKMMSSGVTVNAKTQNAAIGADVAKLKAAADATGDAKRPSNIDHLINDGHVAPDGTIIPPTHFMEKAADRSLPVADREMRNRLEFEITAEALKAK